MAVVAIDPGPPLSVGLPEVYDRAPYELNPGEAANMTFIRTDSGS